MERPTLTLTLTVREVPEAPGAAKDMRALREENEELRAQLRGDRKGGERKTDRLQTTEKRCRSSNEQYCRKGFHHRLTSNL